MKIAIYNSTYNPEISPLVHFGCELVKETIAQQLDRVGHEYYFIPWQQCVNNTYTISDDTDLVLVNGEGSWHNKKRHDMLSIAEKHTCVMFNTVYQNNSYTASSLNKFKAIYTRESMSAEAVIADGGNPTVIPDIILTNENILKRNKSSVIQRGHIDHYDGVKTLQRYKPFLDQLEKYSHVASGSYHGVLVCAMLDIPFSMWPSNTHKMIALAKDMGVKNTHHTDKSSAINAIPETMAESIKEYVVDGQNKINDFFDNLTQYV
tara:strand:+ start:1250 stop:2038 length:789 start_codon:yes stop_codon:yes gene_type:complete